MTRTTLAWSPAVQSCSISHAPFIAKACSTRLRPARHRFRDFTAALIGLGALAFVSPVVLAAECTLRGQVTGSVSNQFFGGAVAAIGDVNGDNVSDFAVGAPAKGPVHALPEVDVFSGQDGSLIYRQPGPVQSEFGSAIAAFGDVNGDGIPDFVVGAPFEVSSGPVEAPAGAVYVLSGRDGTTIHRQPGPIQSEFGFAVATGPDLDGDGVVDLIAGAPNADGGSQGSGAAFVLSGSTGSLIQVLRGEKTGDRFGESIEVFPERIPGPVQVPVEVLVGAPGADVSDGTTTLLDAGAAYLFSPLSTTPTRRFNGANAEDHFGASVAFLRGSRTFDPPDSHRLLVGAPNALTSSGTRPGLVNEIDPAGPGGGSIHILEGSLDGEAFGTAVEGVGDVTGDTVPDILVGAPGKPLVTAISGSVSVIAGGNGLLLCRMTGFSPGELFGFSLSEFGDLDGDGFPEWLAGAPLFSVGPVAPLGQARIFGVSSGPPPGHLKMIDVDNTPAKILLSWTPVASTCAAFDYAVYAGRYSKIGEGMGGYLPETCSTAGLTTVSMPLPAIFPPGTAFLYIPTAVTVDEEGSYGQGTLGNEHPQSLRPCHVFMNTGACP